jgi:hypothetical protein
MNKKIFLELGKVADCNPSWLYSEALSQQKKINKNWGPEVWNPT